MASPKTRRIALARTPMMLSRKPEPSAMPTKMTQRRTWDKFQEEVMPGVPAYPLTPEKVGAVVDKMKLLGYKSIPNYITAVKRWHIEKGYTIDERLKLALFDGNLKGRWRRGPPKRS